MSAIWREWDARSMLKKTKAKIAFIIASFISYVCVCARVILCVHCAMYIRTHAFILSQFCILAVELCVSKHLTIEFGYAHTHTQNSLIKDEEHYQKIWTHIQRGGVSIQITVNPSAVELYGEEPMKKPNEKKKCVWFHIKPPHQHEWWLTSWNTVTCFHMLWPVQKRRCEYSIHTIVSYTT